MPLPTMIDRFRSAMIGALLCGAVLPSMRGSQARAADDAPAAAGMAHMSAHMVMTAARPEQSGDRRRRRDALVETAKQAMAPYLDYRKALSDGYEIFLPNIPASLSSTTLRSFNSAWRPDRISIR